MPGDKNSSGTKKGKKVEILPSFSGNLMGFIDSLVGNGPENAKVLKGAASINCNDGSCDNSLSSFHFSSSSYPSQEYPPPVDSATSAVTPKKP